MIAWRQRPASGYRLAYRKGSGVSTSIPALGMVGGDHERLCGLANPAYDRFKLGAFPSLTDETLGVLVLVPQRETSVAWL